MTTDTRERKAKSVRRAVPPRRGPRRDRFDDGEWFFPVGKAAEVVALVTARAGRYRPAEEGA